MLLSEKTNQAEELTGTVEEYRVMTQELKAEIRRLQDQLSQISGDLSRLVKDPLEEVPSVVRLQVKSVCTEIEDLMQGGCNEEGLTSPLCGVFPWSSIGAYTVEVLLVELCAEMSSTDFWCITEELITHCRERTLTVIKFLPSDREDRRSPEKLAVQIESLRQELEEQSQVFLQRLCCLTELKRTWEVYLYKLKVGLQKFKQLDQKEKPACVYTRMSTNEEKQEKEAEIMNNEEREHEDAAEYDEGADGEQRQNTKVKKVISYAFLETERQGYTATSSATRKQCDLSLVPVNNQLVLWRPQSCGGATVPWFSCYLHNLLQGRCWLALALLLTLLLCLLLLVLSFPHTGREPIWAAMKMIFWPHIQLQYLRPPPV